MKTKCNIILIALVLLSLSIACDDSDDDADNGSDAIPMIPNQNVDDDFDDDADDDSESTTTTTAPPETTTTTTTTTTIEATTTTEPTTTTSVTTTTRTPIPTIPNLKPELIDGGMPGGTGTSIAMRQGGGLYIASEKEGRLVVYSVIGNEVIEEFIDSVDSPPSLALDSQGRLHVAYFNPDTNSLMHALKDAGVWTIEAADSSGVVGWQPSMVLDATGNVHISYYEIFNANLKYAVYTGGAWATQIVATQGDVGSYSSIGVDSSDNIHIAFYDDTNDNLQYATNESGDWVSEIVDDNGAVGRYPSLAIDAGENIHISYQGHILEDVSCLKYVSNTSGLWTAQIIDAAGGVGAYNSLALDAAGAVHISYYNEDDKNLKYASDALGQWTMQSVDTAGDIGEFTSLALNAAGQAYISYYDATLPGVKYATNTAGSWSIVPVDWADETGIHNSIFLDAGGDAHLSYIDKRTNRLRYATDQSGPWTVQNVDDLDEDFADDWTTSLAMDSGGMAHIIFADQNSVQYATNAYGPWVVQVVDDDGTLVETRIDSADNLHATYAQSGGALVYALNEGAGWTTQILSSSFDEILHTAIAVDQGGYVHIIFTGDGDSTRDLETIYTTNQTGEWIQNPMDDVGEYIELSVDSDSFAHATYIESGHTGELKYATNESGAWQSDFVVTSGDLPGFHAHVLDTSGLVHVVYPCGWEQVGYCGLRYAMQDANPWPRYEIHPGMAAPHADIAVDASGDLLVSYYQNGGLWITTFPPQI